MKADNSHCKKSYFSPFLQKLRQGGGRSAVPIGAAGKIWKFGPLFLISEHFNSMYSVFTRSMGSFPMPRVFFRRIACGINRSSLIPHKFSQSISTPPLRLSRSGWSNNFLLFSAAFGVGMSLELMEGGGETRCQFFPEDGGETWCQSVAEGAGVTRCCELKFIFQLISIINKIKIMIIFIIDFLVQKINAILSHQKIWIWSWFTSVWWILVCFLLSIALFSGQ